MDIKVEIQEEPHFLDLSSQNDRREVCSKDFLKSEIITSDCNIDIKTEIEEPVVSNFCSQNRGEFVSEDPSMEFSNGSAFEPKVEIKEEQCLVKTTSTENLCIYNDTKQGTDEDFSSIKSPKLCREAVTGESSVKSSSTEVLGKSTSFYNGKDDFECKSPESDVTEIPTIEEHVHSEQSDSSIDRGKNQSGALYLKQNNLIDKGERPHRCNICYKSFTLLSSLNSHYLIHDNSYSQFSQEDWHNLFREGKRPYSCNTCNRNFSRLSNLKRHILFHEGTKPHKCETCEKGFTQLSDLKKHILIHEGKKPHKCDVCEKGFTAVSDLKRHHLIHEGKKPHKCETCDKRFTRLSNLKRHTLLH